MLGSENKIVLTKEDADFVEALLKQHQRVIMSVIRANLNHHLYYLAEDCLSEVYLVACQNVSELKKHAHPDGWLAVTAKYITIRLAKDEMKNLRKIGRAVEHTAHEHVFESALYNIWLEEKMPEKILGTLTKREKEIYEMIYIRCMKNDEIARQLGISESTIRNINKSIVDKIEYYIKKNCR